MKSSKRILGVVTKNHNLDSDELLLELWDQNPDRFDYLKNKNSVIKNKDFPYLKKILKRKNSAEQEQENKEKQIPVQLIYEDFNFSNVGKTNELETIITLEEVQQIHEELALDFAKFEDPIIPAGIKDSKLLESAIFHHTTSFAGCKKYATLESAAAALMYAMTHNHAFHNGNKRTAIVTMLVFLDRNNIFLTCNHDDLFKTSLKLADHKLTKKTHRYPDAEVFELAKWIHANSKVVKKGERPITVKKLKQTLAHFDCEVLPNGRVRRELLKDSIFGLKKKEVLTSKVSISTSLRESQVFDRGLIKALRDDLHLNVENGIDSDLFYEKTEYTPSDFITNYRSVLKRLAKF